MQILLLLPWVMTAEVIGVTVGILIATNPRAEGRFGEYSLPVGMVGGGALAGLLIAAATMVSS